MKLRQKKKNYKKKYGRNPIKDINGKYMLKYPPIIAATRRVGQNLAKSLMNVTTYDFKSFSNLSTESAETLRNFSKSLKNIYSTVLKN